MDLAYRSAHVALSLWCFLAAAVHAGLHAGIVAGKLAPWTKKLEERIGLWGVRITGLVVLALLLWRTTVAYVVRTSRTRLWPRPPICTWNAGSLRSSSRLTF